MKPRQRMHKRILPQKTSQRTSKPFEQKPPLQNLVLNPEKMWGSEARGIIAYGRIPSPTAEELKRISRAVAACVTIDEFGVAGIKSVLISVGVSTRSKEAVCAVIDCVMRYKEKFPKHPLLIKTALELFRDIGYTYRNVQPPENIANRIINAANRASEQETLLDAFQTLSAYMTILEQNKKYLKFRKEGGHVITDEQLRKILDSGARKSERDMRRRNKKAAQILDFLRADRLRRWGEADPDAENLRK